MREHALANPGFQQNYPRKPVPKLTAWRKFRTHKQTTGHWLIYPKDQGGFFCRCYSTVSDLLAYAAANKIHVLDPKKPDERLPGCIERFVFSDSTPDSE